MREGNIAPIESFHSCALYFRNWKAYSTNRPATNYIILLVKDKTASKLNYVRDVYLGKPFLLVQMAF